MQPTVLDKHKGFGPLAMKMKTNIDLLYQYQNLFSNFLFDIVHKFWQAIYVKTKNGNSKKILLLEKKAFLCHDEIYKNDLQDEKRIKRIMSS